MWQFLPTSPILQTSFTSKLVLQSEYMDEIATATEEMNTIIADNARNASITAQAAERNGSIAKEGGGVVALTAEKDAPYRPVMAHRLEQLKVQETPVSKSSELLMLLTILPTRRTCFAWNAAIEAARAGDQGRRFCRCRR